MGDRNGMQRDYVVPVLATIVAIVLIVSASVVALSVANREDALVLIGVLGAVCVTPVFAVLFPLLKSVDRSVNRAVAANEATAEGVESIKHSLNGGFEDRVTRAVAAAVEPLRSEIGAVRSEIGEMKKRLTAGDRKFDVTEKKLDEMGAVLDQLTSCETKPQGDDR